MKTMTRCLAFGAGLALAGPAAASTFTVYDSGDSSEMISTLPGDNSWQVLYSVDLVSVSEGDLLVVFAEGQLQDPANTTDFYLTSHLIRAASPTATTGTEIDDANAFNITEQSYRGIPIKPAITKVSGATNQHYVNLLVQAKGDLNVNSDYGRLQVLKITP